MEGTDRELLGEDGFDIEEYAPQLQDLKDPRGYLNGVEIFDYAGWDRDDYARARNLYDNIANNSPYKKWSFDDPVFDWKEMEKLQSVGPRYRK